MKLNLKKISNPFMLFAIAWAVCLMLYTVGWSELFPKISPELLIFLIVCIFVFSITGVFYNKIPASSSPKIDFKFRYKTLFIVNLLLNLLNFIYSGVPVLSGTRDYEFGIPTVIVIATTLNGFCSVYGFYLFLIQRKRYFLLYVFICLLVFALEYSRGYIMMSLVTMFFLWMNEKKPVLTLKKLMIIVTSVLMVLYLFGVAGNYRVGGEFSERDPRFDNKYNNSVILDIGSASDSFRNNLVPNEFYWTYLYITSPLSNLQYNITIHPSKFTLQGMVYLFIDELLFDTVSKRIDGTLNRKRVSADLIVEALTVPTTLAGSYNYAGWIGMGIFMVVFWTLPLFYTLAVINNPFRIIGLSTLCTIYFLSIFDNMLILTGLSFQLLYPIILFVLHKGGLNKRSIATN